MQPQRIAIIGAGVAGLASACFLRKRGHDVTVYERFEAPKPVGAGLLLQPTGLAVLAALALDERIINGGSRIDFLQGKVSGSRFNTLFVDYASAGPHLFGVGVYRDHLFSALHECALSLGTRIHAAHPVTHIETRADGLYPEGKDGPYDLVIDASGSKSQLRRNHAVIHRERAYPYGAIWGIVRNTGNRFHNDRLDQRYQHAWHMIGVMPVGQLGADDTVSSTFFWSLKVADYPAWKSAPLSRWQDKVISLWPETESLVKQFTSHDDLTLATYSDVTLKRTHTGNIVFIGDAAHCTSPQLGQGANLALMDAWVLAQSLGMEASIPAALERYGKTRRAHLRYYQWASRILTPFFQSDSRLNAWLRFPLCGLACAIPFTRRLGAKVLCGAQTGLFSELDLKKLFHQEHSR